MATTNFIPGTVVASAWLNPVDSVAYNTLAAVTGTNAITAVGPLSYTAYTTGSRFFFNPQNTNSGAVTLNITGLGVRNVTKYGVTALVAGDLVAGTIAEIYYDGAQFQLINPLTVATNVTGRLLGVQTFTANGTYTPPAGTTSVVVEVLGGGGGGGGTAATGPGQCAVGGGGGAGGRSLSRQTTGFSGAAVVVGAAGVGAAGIAGTAGGNSSFAGTIIGNGGGGGGAGTAGAIAASAGGLGGVSSGGSITNATGAPGETAVSSFAAGIYVPGMGGSSVYGGGALPQPANNLTAAGGQNATGRGAGGGGAAAGASIGAVAGGNGTAGLVIVYAYS